MIPPHHNVATLARTESSKISMAEILVRMELVDQNIKLLGEEGAISPLVEMASRSLESKKSSLAALSKLSNHHDNKNQIAAAGGVPLVLEQMFSPHVPSLIRISCSEILERLTEDGIEFLVNESGNLLELESIIANLFSIQQSKASSHSIRKPSLRALLGIYKSEEEFKEKAIVGAKGVTVILPLLEDSDPEVRELAVSLLFHLAQYEPQAIVDFLLLNQRLKSFMGFLEDESRDDVRMAAAGLLANLPKSELALTKSLIELEALPLILNILKSGTMKAKENALSVLFRFTDPTNLEMQRMVVELEAYPLLISFLKLGSVTAKARAAALIGNLSLNSPKLTAVPEKTGCWCLRRARISFCEAHGGVCNIKTSFCLIKANALPELVKLLREGVNETFIEALRALATLIQGDSSSKGASVLHEANAIDPMLEALIWGSSSLKEEILFILEKVFANREVGDIYCSKARIPLVTLTTQSHEDGQLGRKAGVVLAQLERCSRSMPLI
ncbi:hypothetical protein ACLOJK_026905 [Asimina triloba]